MVHQNEKAALEIFESALKGADPYIAVCRTLTLKNNRLRIKKSSRTILELNLKEIDKIIIIGAGKATAMMARGVEEVLKDRISYGLVSVPYGDCIKLNHIKCLEASHPMPDDNTIENTKRIIELIEDCKQDDLIISLISGGGSSLLEYPVKNVSLNDLRVITQNLLTCGATIDELNAIRKKISMVKAGKLVKIAYPARIISLIISDVLGDRLSSIASGPTVRDDSESSDAYKILKKYKLLNKTPESIKKIIIDEKKNKKLDFSDISNEIFRNVYNVLICNNRSALKSAEKKAIELGFNTIILTSYLKGEAKKVGRRLARYAKKVVRKKHAIKKPICIISGGETTVKVKGSGKGGRNQELVLSFLINIGADTNFTFLSAGTDGIDGNTDAAGAIVSKSSIMEIKRKKICPKKYLKENDSYKFFDMIGGTIKTGRTGTNVMDIQILLIDK